MTPHNLGAPSFNGYCQHIGHHDLTTNFGDPNAWQCWRVNRYLGPPGFAGYCAQAGLGTSKLAANDADGWYCTAPSAPVDTTAMLELTPAAPTRLAPKI